MPRVPHDLPSRLAPTGVRAQKRVLHDPPHAVGLAELRQRLRMTQEEFALTYGLDVKTVQNWEQGRAAPSAAARSFLNVIATDPALAEEAAAA